MKYFWINRRAILRKYWRLIFKNKRVLVIDLDALRDDPGFRITWESNIAMAIKDEYQRLKIRRGIDNWDSISDAEMKMIADRGANRFVDMLTHEKAPLL